MGANKLTGPQSIDIHVDELGRQPGYPHQLIIKRSDPIAEAWREEGRREARAEFDAWLGDKSTLEDVITLPEVGSNGTLLDAVVSRVLEAIEKGRREVLREIATAGEPVYPYQPIDDGLMCVWCYAHSIHQRPIPHEPSCLWLRAQAAVAPTEVLHVQV